MSQLDRLGLAENPFHNTDARYFYADQNRTEILDSAEKLIDTSADFQVIIGEQGVGKTHFLQALKERVDDNLRVVKVLDATEYNSDNLIAGMLKALAAKQFDNNTDLLEVLETQLAEINTFGFKPVFFIDNAEMFSLESLHFLVQLSQQKQNDKPYINIVLFATTEITECLQDQRLKDYRDVIHLATLNPFAHDDIFSYLKYKMLLAGFEREIPFTDRIIDSIFKDSKGIAKDIDFFADKFLASSGKADNYINVDEDQVNESDSSGEKLPSEKVPNEKVPNEKVPNEKVPNEKVPNEKVPNEKVPNEKLNVSTNRVAGKDNVGFLMGDQVDDFDQLMNNDLLDSLDELSEHRGDRAEEQLTRLTQQFDEIEQIETDSTHSFTKNSVANEEDELDELFSDNLNASSESSLPKFVIPMAVIGLFVVALIIASSLFEQSEKDLDLAHEGKSGDEVASLSLELPPEKDDSINGNNNSIDIADNDTVEQINNENVQEFTLIDQIGASTDNIDNNAVTDSYVAGVEEVTQQTENVSRPANKLPDREDNKPLVTSSAPQLNAIEPKLIIGSNHRQAITISGNNFQKDTRLIVNWTDGNKVFSQENTPKQWEYINKNKIKLHLNTGTTKQQWQIFAKNSNDRESRMLSFEVVKPYSTKLLIKEVYPALFVGSRSAQKIEIKGQGFAKDVVIEIRWDKKKKRFSSKLTPTQFEYINANQINLSITTGVKPRKWLVNAINPTGKSSRSSFVVTDKAVPQTQRSQTTSIVKLRDEQWLKRQANDHYTIQLAGSHNKKAINNLIQKYALPEDVLIYTTMRDGREWYTITYGSYASKKEAEQAVKGLDAGLIKTPWIRTFASIKEQLPDVGNRVTAKPKSQANEKSTAKRKSATVVADRTASTKSSSKRRNGNEWVRSQVGENYTIQLIALSSEDNVKKYIEKYILGSEAVYFKTRRDKKGPYLLIYGSYRNQNAAQQVGDQLAQRIPGSKPWVRNFSVIHKLMDE